MTAFENKGDSSLGLFTTNGQCYETRSPVDTNLFFKIYENACYEHIFMCFMKNSREKFDWRMCTSHKIGNWKYRIL